MTPAAWTGKCSSLAEPWLSVTTRDSATETISTTRPDRTTGMKYWNPAPVTTCSITIPPGPIRPWTGVDINSNAYQDQSISSALNDPYDPASGSRDLTDDEGVGDPPGYMTWTDDGDGVFEQGECPDVNDVGFDYNSQFVATVAGFGPTQVMTAAEQTNFANWYRLLPQARVCSETRAVADHRRLRCQNGSCHAA